MRPQTPRWINRLLLWYCNPIYANEIAGDLEELFELWVQESGPRKARWRYAWNALLFIRMYNSRFGQNSNVMNPFYNISHYLKLSLRNLQRFKVFHAGNIIGMAFGLGVSLLILVHVDRELGYEKHISEHEQIYRISTHQEWAKSSVILAEKLSEFFPQMNSIARFARYSSGMSIVSTKQAQTTAMDIFQADSTVFSIFDVQLTIGSDKPLTRPNTAVLSESLVQRLFGDESAIGQIIEINDGQELEVVAVFKDLPATSHLKIDVLLSMDTFYANTPPDWVNNPGWMVMYTYVKTRPEVTYDELRSAMLDFQKFYIPEEYWDEYGNNYFEVMPLTEIHLKSHRIQEMGENSDMTYVIIFGSLALFILLIAAVNFVNIFTAIGLRRVRELGVRKLVGAARSNLIMQLQIESMLSSLIAAGAAIGLAIALLPWYNQAMGMQVTVAIFLAPSYLLMLFGVAILIGFLSGLYPALLVTAQDPLQTVTRNESPQSTISYFRKALIVLQFSLSLFVFIGGVVIWEQLRFIEAQDLGYDKESVLAIKTYGDLRERFHDQHQQIKHQISSIPGVKGVGRTSNLVGEQLSYETFNFAEEPAELEGTINMIWTDESFLATMGIALIEGENFRKLDTGIAFLVNESMAQALGGEVVGKFARWRDEQGPIVGVINDFHHYSLKNAIEPTVLAYRPEWASQWLVRIEQSNVPNNLQELESLVKATSPNSFFISEFLEARVARLYKGEQHMLGLVGILTSLALIISCVGLLGVASVEIRRRIKEVSIRKVLGASPVHVMGILSKQFAIMTIIALIVALPASIWFAQYWLANFDLQVGLKFSVFMVPTVLVCLTILAVVFAQSIPLLRKNPGMALRKE
ncbi:MAG: FtsX-like permease family protein [Cytophagales bacterium]|nr:FtsX-like permease family protein [Cytophagales bacterium]